MIAAAARTSGMRLPSSSVLKRGVAASRSCASRVRRAAAARRARAAAAERARLVRDDEAFEVLDFDEVWPSLASGKAVIRTAERPAAHK